MIKKSSCKEGFLWRGATVANQSEGGYLSDGKGLAWLMLSVVVT